MSEPIVDAQGVTKLYGVVIGVNDLSVSFPLGVHGILGPNGAGKSTFMKLLTGMLRPSEGTLRVFGESPWNNPNLFRRVGFCPEYDAFYQFMTGHEFVTLLGELAGFDKTTARERAAAALERCGCTAFMGRKISTYSKGMRQRTKVAQAIMHDPKLVILDEPLNGTDPVGRRHLIQLVRELGEEGKCILISSHVLHEVQAMTEQFALIFHGRILAAGNVAEIRDLMNEFPHQLRFRCDNAKRLGARIVHELPVAGVELSRDEANVMTVMTRDPAAFYERLPAIVRDEGVAVYEMTAQDDSLETVFDYLVGRDG